MPTTTAPRILIADDQPDVLEALRLLLKGERFAIETAASPEEVIQAVEARAFDAVLIDLNYTRDTTSGREGLNLLSVLRASDETLPVVVMTAWGSVESAVEAMRRGAGDYVEKPWDNQRLITILRTQVELGRALRRSRRLESENELLRRDGLPELIAGSAAMRPVLEVMERIGPSDANVLITGEHGTGKEVVARWLHAASPRAERPLVTVNSGALSDGVFESEMFGHVKGAFTDARTDRAGYFGLAVIASRADALSRFMTAHARLARLPPPTPAPMDVGEWVRRVAHLETRLAVEVVDGPTLALHADPDQLEQLLINLVRNAVDAARETDGGVRVGWGIGAHGALEVWVEDEGLGLPETANLFVPFFTTKPGGSGIGLVLCRQIAEAHGGSLALENREDARGCRALLRLPLGDALAHA